VGSFQLVCLSLLFLLLWAPVSIGFISQLVKDKDQLNQKVMALKVSLFELEDLHEHIFDKVYFKIEDSIKKRMPTSFLSSIDGGEVSAPEAPKSGPGTASSAPNPTVPSSLLAQQGLSKMSSPGENKEEGVVIGSSPPPQEAKVQAPEALDENLLQKKLEIKNFKLEEVGGFLEVVLELHNLDKNKAQQGTVWGVAFYKRNNPSGTEQAYELLGLPSTIQIRAESEEPMNLKGGHRFHVRNFSRISLKSSSFGEKFDGTLEKIKLGVYSLREKKVILEKTFNSSSQEL
ncbi:MAG: hypothetical protein KA436_10445, partial [Oligoflexales bacterium]|nr:hypothetical protein [Oligoflexales bacterium]